MRKLKTAIILGLPFLVWLFVFRHFLSLEKSLGWDAKAYYEHVKFFVENILTGQYPFWEPNRDYGIPFELFSRRIGSYNPFYGFLCILRLVQIPFNTAYMVFLAAYFFLGCLLFYKTLKLFFGRSWTSYVGYALFLFSGIGLQVFYSYLLFLVTPMVGFFYCLCAFFKKQRRVHFLGSTLTFCILMQTYIPLYFLAVLCIALLIWAICYFDHLGNSISVVMNFARSQKWVVAVSLIGVLLSMSPGLHLIWTAHKHEFALRDRHYGSTDVSELAVSKEKVAEGGFIPAVLFEEAYSDVEDFGIRFFYIPLFVFIPLALGSLFVLKRRYAFWMIVSLALLLLSVSDLSRGFDFFVKFVPACKYFRNYEFFFYIAVTPFLILASCEMFHQLLYGMRSQRALKFAMVGVTVIVHAFLIWFIYSLNDSMTLTVWLLCASACYWCAWFLLEGVLPKTLCGVLSMLIVVLPSAQAFINADRNAETREVPYRYEDGVPGAAIIGAESAVTMANKGARNLEHTIVNPHVFKLYLKIRNKLFWSMLHTATLYNSTQPVTDESFDPLIFGNRWSEGKGPAFVDRDDTDRPSNADVSSADNDGAFKFHEGDIKDFASGIDWLKFSIDINRPQFIVYGMSYESQWEGFIDGQERPLYRSNGAFIGMWIPPGRHTIMFRYGSVFDKAGSWGLLLFFYSLLAWVSVEARASSRLVRSKSRKRKKHG